MLGDVFHSDSTVCYPKPKALPDLQQARRQSEQGHPSTCSCLTHRQVDIDDRFPAEPSSKPAGSMKYPSETLQEQRTLLESVNDGTPKRHCQWGALPRSTLRSRLLRTASFAAYPAWGLPCSRSDASRPWASSSSFDISVPLQSGTGMKVRGKVQRPGRRSLFY